MIKKIIDAIFLAALIAFVGVGLWLEVFGESPHAPGHWSTQAKIVVWSGFPSIFGLIWLIVRYANAMAKRFPRLVSHDGKPGLLFYFVNVVLGLVFLERFVAAFFAN
jgi:hypothetical protein